MEILTLGGCEFRIMGPATLEHQITMDRLVLESGIAKILESKPTTENAGEYAGRVWEALARSGKVFELLGGLIIPAEIPDIGWTSDEARRTAEHLKHISDPGEIAGVRSILIRMVLGFFEAARPLPEPSATASLHRAARALANVT